MRKIIQIAVESHIDKREDVAKTVWGLCNDGTLWVFGSSDSEWNQLPPIPNGHQEDKEEG